MKIKIPAAVILFIILVNTLAVGVGISQINKIDNNPGITNTESLWQQINEDGFGNCTNKAFRGIEIFNGSLIVGTAKSMPGFGQEFGQSQMFASKGGVLISQETYIEIMDIPPIPYLDKIFIKLREDKIAEALIIEDLVDENYQFEYDFDITNLIRRVAQQESAFFVLDVLFSLIALTTVFICVFGLLSSSYSTIIERKKEIGIVRTLGLRGKEINRLFILESLIIMISSGTIGIIIGWLTSWLVSFNLLGTLAGMPTVLYVPWFNILLIYSLSVIMIYLGMKILLRKVRKQKIVEIYRETV